MSTFKYINRVTGGNFYGFKKVSSAADSAPASAPKQVGERKPRITKAQLSQEHVQAFLQAK